MKRLLHALAALWPERRGEGTPPSPDTRTGILQHWAAVLRMDRIICGFADSPIRKFAKETVGADALNDLSVLDGGLNVSKPEQSNFANTHINESVAQPKNLTHISRPMPLLKTVIPVIFMCLMAAKQVSAQAEPAEAADWIIPQGGVVIGDSLPNWFWDIQLRAVNVPGGNAIIHLNDYRDKLLVLDFWATYCGPCVASMEKWNDMQIELGDEKISVIGIHLYHHNHLPEAFAKKKGWKLPISVGNHADTLLNQLFYERRRFGQVWIKDGRLLAIPKSKFVSKELVMAILSGQQVDIQMESSNTYFDPKRTQK